MSFYCVQKFHQIYSDQNVLEDLDVFTYTIWTKVIGHRHITVLGAAI